MFQSPKHNATEHHFYWPLFYAQTKIKSYFFLPIRPLIVYVESGVTSFLTSAFEEFAGSLLTQDSQNSTKSRVKLKSQSCQLVSSWGMGEVPFSSLSFGVRRLSLSKQKHLISFWKLTGKQACIMLEWAIFVLSQGSSVYLGESRASFLLNWKEYSLWLG